MKGFFLSIENQREVLEKIGGKLGVKSPSDWYNINLQSIKKQGGRKILSLYNDSPIKLLTTIYPDFNWELWKFSRVPKNYFKGYQKLPRNRFLMCFKNR